MAQIEVVLENGEGNGEIEIRILGNLRDGLGWMRGWIKAGYSGFINIKIWGVYHRRVVCIKDSEHVAFKELSNKYVYRELWN